MNERPTCDYCERKVRERFWYVINGDVICRQCLNDNFRKGADEDEGDEDE